MSRHLAKEATGEEHPDDIYTPAMHTVNLKMADLALTQFGARSELSESTPWLKADSPHGDSLIRVDSNGVQSRITLVTTRTGREYGLFFSGLKPHFVKDIIDLKNEEMQLKSKIYLPIHQHIGILFNQPVSAGMMMGYPTIQGRPREASITIQETKPTEPATLENVSGLFTDRPIALKHRVKVVLPTKII
jgi:hypothetical protein